MCAVEWKKLGDVCKIMNGKDYKSFNEGIIPVYGSGGVIAYIDTFAYDKPSVLLPRKGSLSNVFYVDEPFWTVDTIYWTMIDGEIIEPRYFFYYMLMQDLEKLNFASGAVPSLTQAILNRIDIPIPSLAKQQEIVSQLDTFTTLISNLESELDMRRKQYGHFREEFYSSLLDCQVELGTFAHCEKERNKKRITENAYSITQKGLIPTKEFFKEKTKVTSNDTSNYYLVQKNWFVYSPSRIDVGSINYLRDKGPAIVSPIDVVFSIDECVCNPNFLLNYLLSQDGMFQILKYRIGVEGTGRRSLPFGDFAKIQVPLPSLETQQEIVEKLDAFEQLIQSLETEIKLRKQQYEYYREKLLTFE